MTGWAVNSIATAVEGSSPFLPIYAKYAFLFVRSAYYIYRCNLNGILTIQYHLVLNDVYYLYAVYNRIVYIYINKYMYKLIKRV